MGSWERSPRAAGRERDAGVAAPETSHTLRRGYRGLTTGDAVRLRHWGLTAGLQNPSIPSCDASDCPHSLSVFHPSRYIRRPCTLKAQDRKGICTIVYSSDHGSLKSRQLQPPHRAPFYWSQIPLCRPTPRKLRPCRHNHSCVHPWFPGHLVS